MSVSSSARRQLAKYTPPSRPPMGTTGKPKGPARMGREIDAILGRKRFAAQWMYEVEMQQARDARRASIRRAVRWALAILAAVLVAAALFAAMPARAEWPESVRADVQAKCRVILPEAPPGFCACFARELERLSPDPDTSATRSEAERAVKACIPLATEI